MAKRYVVIEEGDSGEGCGMLVVVLMAAAYVLGEVLNWIEANLWIVGIIAIIVIIIGVWRFKKE